MNLKVSAPGRICLFGEHQDYLGFPVVAAAVDLRATIVSDTRTDRRVKLVLSDLNETHEWELDALPEPNPREYWLSVLHLAAREGWLPTAGWTARVTSAIPQQAGASSSSALTAAWCATVARRAGRSISDEADREWVAHATWRAEVEWFGEPGGKMDQTVCAMGGVRRVHFSPEFKLESLPTPGGAWLLIDSQEPKDTLGILGRAKHERLALLEAWGVAVGAEWPTKRPERPTDWNSDAHRLMDATIAIRQVSELGGKAVESMPRNAAFIGEQLQVHHHWLSHGLRVSTSKIDGLLDAALDAGAWGGKINGSGGGGTAFVVVPSECAERVSQVISSMQARAIPIELGASGVQIDHLFGTC